MSKNRRNKKYPNGGDGMFFYHKKTKHPAKQIRHSNKTWTNKCYTHSPNNISNYCIGNELSNDTEKIYCLKSTFIDSIYTRGMPYRKLNKKSVINNANCW